MIGIYESRPKELLLFNHASDGLPFRELKLTLNVTIGSYRRNARLFCNAIP